jgi:hypothetical protein
MFFACKTLVKSTIPVSSMKFIISGMPCCGKTYFGDWLRDTHAYTHVNLEARTTASGRISAPAPYAELPEWLAELSPLVVVTWGYRPVQPAFEFMRRFEAAGFTPWWFDTSPELSRRRYIERDGVERTGRFFEPQMEKLHATAPLISATYRERRLVTLDENGYLAPEAILAHLQAASAA